MALRHGGSWRCLNQLHRPIEEVVPYVDRAARKLAVVAINDSLGASRVALPWMAAPDNPLVDQHELRPVLCDVAAGVNDDSQLRVIVVRLLPWQIEEVPRGE